MTENAWIHADDAATATPSKKESTVTTRKPATSKLTDQQQADLRVRILKDGGATWRSIADLMGFGWNGANMDGGRAKRAYNRAVKAELNRQLTKAELAWIEKVGKPGAKKAAPAKPEAKATPAKRTRKPKVVTVAPADLVEA